MSDAPTRKPSKSGRTFAEKIGADEARKLKARSNPSQVWFGLGMMGVIGWSVATPTLLGAAVGQWLDGRHWGRHSWTLALLLAGLVVGCVTAWHWVAREDLAIKEEQGPPDE